MRFKFSTFAFMGVAILIGGAIGGCIGWRIGQKKIATSSSAVRESGYQFVSPLLVCSLDRNQSYDSAMSKVVQNVVQKETSAGNVNIASVYYRDFSNGNWLSENDTEEYFPASLGKVPLMIAYYSSEEADNNIVFDKQIYYPPGEQDANTQQEIKPANPIQPGRYYSAAQLIDAMIKDSDNNATELLFANIDMNYIKNVFTDLNVPYLAPGATPADFMTVQDYAFFFRVLYNGTYLSHVDSEKALTTLSETSFKDGLVAGVPAEVKVAHKFGLASVAPDGTDVTSRELHDCGIVYNTGGPYLLCVMTKSTAPLKNAEQAIADISSAVYAAKQAGK